MPDPARTHVCARILSRRRISCKANREIRRGLPSRHAEPELASVIDNWATASTPCLSRAKESPTTRIQSRVGMSVNSTDFADPLCLHIEWRHLGNRQDEELIP